jgi:hypothetical protein
MIAGVLAIAALTLVLVTVGASHPLFPTAVTFAIFVCIFPVHFRTVIVGVRLKRKTGASMDLAKLVWPPPFSKRVGFVILAVYTAVALLVALSMSSISGGQPEKHGNRYYLDDHGTLTEVSQASYYAGVIGVDRLFLGVASIFLGAGAVFNLRLAKGAG